MKTKILKWLASDNTGMSSQFMAFTAIEIKPKYTSHPYDPSDLNRCILLVEEVPEIKEKFNIIAKSSKEWGAVINNWDALVSLFHSEVGENWSKGLSAPLTYNEMKRLFEQC